jgi:hypothetical protein
VKYHDFHLRSYSVGDFGKTITLDLFYNYPNSSKEESEIRFVDVVAYHFIHTGGAIIAEIEEIPLPELLKRFGVKLLEWSRQHGGLKFLDGDLTNYKTTLESEGYKSWYIVSAIGFEGFVIAKKVE